VPARLTASGFAVGRQLRGSGQLLAPRREPLEARQRRRDPGRGGRRGRRAPGRRLGAGLTPDRAKTFTAGASPESADASGSTPGPTPQLAHLRSVVGLVWRSVVLWMLLLALLSLAHSSADRTRSPRRPGGEASAHVDTPVDAVRLVARPPLKKSVFVGLVLRPLPKAMPQRPSIEIGVPFFSPASRGACPSSDRTRDRAVAEVADEEARC
jgi:hypothetical protein